MLRRDSVAVALFDVAGACFSSQRPHFIFIFIFNPSRSVNPVLLTIQTALSDWSALIFESPFPLLLSNALLVRCIWPVITNICTVVKY